jgi:hypothetical protein
MEMFTEKKENFLEEGEGVRLAWHLQAIKDRLKSHSTTLTVDARLKQ